MKTIRLITLGILAAVMITACSDDNEENTLTLNINGLEDLGSDFVYEGWAIIGDNPVTTGTFTVDANGRLSQTTFEVENLQEATTFVLTIEPTNDPDPAPSAVHILGGDFSGSAANVTIGHSTALGTTLSDASGGFILATPTDMDDTNEASGVWFLDNSSGAPATGLSLPTLPEGWIYEGWAVVNGQPLTTGKFRSAMGADLAAPYSGPLNNPPFPGEDFLTNAPAGLSFPVDLRQGTIVISVEPVPDNSPAPFTLKPLTKMVDAGSDVHSFIGLNNANGQGNPVGSVSRG